MVQVVAATGILRRKLTQVAELNKSGTGKKPAHARAGRCPYVETGTHGGASPAWDVYPQRVRIPMYCRICRPLGAISKSCRSSVASEVVRCLMTRLHRCKVRWQVPAVFVYRLRSVFVS